MITVKKIYNFLNEIAPFSSSMEYDNTGLLAGNFENKVEKVVLSLDITNEVCNEAKNLGAQLIISHHPVIFKAIKNINFKSPVANLIKNEKNAICAHTNLDIAEKGVNFELAKALKLSNLKTLTFENSHPLGLVGNLEKAMNCNEFAKFVKENLLCEGLRYTEIKKEIKKVAVCSGSGGSLVESVFEAKADAFVTGEIKHSDILKANSFGIQVVDTGHFKSENVIIKPLEEKLKRAFPEIEFFTSKTFTDGIKYL